MAKSKTRKLLALLLSVVVLISSISASMISALAAAGEKQTLNISVVTTKTDNDLLTTLQANYNGIEHYTSLDTALTDADEGQGIMVLADNYPGASTAITDTQAAIVNEKGIRLYIEYPKNNATLGITGFGEASAAGNMYYDRAVIMNTATGLNQYDLLYVHGAKYLKKEDTTNSWIVNAKVAGYDTAIYELDGCVAETDTTLAAFRQNHVPYSMLEINTAGNVLICSTKFSQFISARYAPYARWNTLWCGILSWVADTTVNSIEWTPAMTATYAADETLSDTAYANAVDANMQWYINNMLPNADGTGGFYQCYNSGYAFNAYGDQSKNTGIRADCTAESIGAMAIAGVMLDNEEYKQIAYNAMDWMLNESNMANGDRADPDSPHYGLFSWYDDNGGQNNYYTTYLKSYYGDDNAKAILGLILGAAALGTDEFDERILEAIMGNFRTTGKNGYRGNHIGSELDIRGWESYYNSTSTNYSPHFEALLWACYLWAYEKTGYEPLYTRSETAIRLMMDSYENTMDGDASSSGEWNWVNCIQANRAKMAWTLSWLVRVSPTEEHIGWLDTMVTDMMAYQDDKTGALGEDLDPTRGYGDCDAPESNAEYGTKETPVVQTAEDKATDSLYVTSFAMVALNEAQAALSALGDGYTAKVAEYQNYSQKITDYHVRIQQSSTNSKYDGVWLRGFDYDKWEVYGSDADAGWGVWCTETGWQNAQISSALSLQELGTNLWDYTSNSKINIYFNDTATLMLGDYYTEPAADITSDVTLRWDVDVLVDGVYADDDATKWNSGKWTGAEGTDITLTLDYGQKKTFDYVTIGFDQYAALGAFIPKSITVYASDDGVEYTKVGEHQTGVDIQAKYDAWYNDGSNDASQIYIDRIKTMLDQTVSARFVKIVVENPMQSYSAAHTGGTVAKTWIFMDEIDVGVTSYSLDDLNTLIDSVYATDMQGKQTDSVLSLENALQSALEHIDSGSNSSSERVEVYNALADALANLKEAVEVTVNSSTANTSGDSWPSISNALNGNYSDEAARWKMLDISTDTAVEGINVILDMGESTSVMAVGYSAQSRPAYGIYLQDAKYYVSDSPDGDWTYVGEVKAEADSNGDYTSADYQTVGAAANGGKGRYIKVEFINNRNNELTIDGNLKKSEWFYLAEILINGFCPITVQTQNATVDMTDSDGNTVGLLGAIYGKDVTVNITPDESTLLVGATVNGEAVTVEENSFVIENVTSTQNIVIEYDTYIPPELPTLTGIKDLYVAKSDAIGFDPRVDIKATDGMGYDITSSVIYDGVIRGEVGTYPITYSVTDSNGMTATATANVYVVDSLNDKYVVAATASIDDVGAHNSMDKAQILVDGQYAPSDATHSNASYMSWKNTDDIEIVVALDGTTTVRRLGYSLAAMPNLGALPPDVDFYVTDKLGVGEATNWRYVGTIDALKHPYDMGTYNYLNRTLFIGEITSGYIKAVIRFDDDKTMLANYSSTPCGGVPEWTFVDEIITSSEGVADTLYWDGATYTEPTDIDGDGVFDIDEASDLAYIACKTAEYNYETFGKTYKVVDGVKSIVMQPESLSEIKDKTSYSEVKAFFEANASEANWWTVIGYEGLVPFQGTLDGNGATVYGLYADWTSYSDYRASNYCGLFGLVDQGAVFKNLAVANSYFATNGGMMGAIAGKASQTDSKWNATSNSGSGTIVFENIMVKNNYMVANGNIDNSGVVIGSTYGCDLININNCLVYGNYAYNKNVSANIGLNGAPYNSTDNKIRNSIILDCTPYDIAGTQGNATKPEVFENIYTNTISPEPAAVKAGWYTFEKYEGIITDISAIGVEGITGKTAMSALDWENVWFATDNMPELRVFHNIKVQNNGDGTHSETCQTCVVSGIGEKHTYVGGVCDCGAKCSHANYLDGTASTDIVCEGDCITDKIIKTYCTECGMQGENHVIPAKGHKFGDVNYAVSGNCTEYGTVEHKTCSVCLKNYAADAAQFAAFETALKTTSDNTLVATNHILEPQAETDGVKAHDKCMLCGKLFINGVEVDAADLVIPALQTGWVEDGDVWYYYKEDGTMATGWEKVNSKWYYFDEDGVMQTGWLEDSGKWYYLKSSGAMATGWAQVSGKWYYMNTSGVMQTGWVKVSSKWYYMNTSGVMQTGWKLISGTWYYFNTSGAMVTGTQTIDGKVYKFDSSGAWIG